MSQLIRDLPSDLPTYRTVRNLDEAKSLCQNVMQIAHAIEIPEDFTLREGVPQFDMYIADLNDWALELDRIPSEIKYQMKTQYFQTFDILIRKCIDVERWKVRYTSFQDFQSQEYQDLSSGPRRFCSVACTLGLFVGYAEKYLPDLEPRLTTWGNIDHESTWLDCGIQIAQLFCFHGYATRAIKIISESNLLVDEKDFNSSIVLLEKTRKVLNLKIAQAEQFQMYHQRILSDCNTSFLRHPIPHQISAPANLKVVVSGVESAQIQGNQRDEAGDKKGKAHATDEVQNSTAPDNDVSMT